ncbi:hypothetical protein PG985_002030 [Apiospora marii]|uniref:Uncharacterized protein n=1 Tax=Apiospora marii TaxID=335849 RepID=A0ABR1RYD9_9PEZI
MSSSDLKRPPSPDPADDQTHGSRRPRSEPGADTPPGMSVKLMPHQRLGLEWLMKREDAYSGSILADDVGLGKTIQTLALILARPAAAKTKNKTTLLVVPLCLLDQWEKELKDKVKPGELRAKIYHSGEARKAVQDWRREPYDVVITTYDMLKYELLNKSRPAAAGSRARNLNLLAPDTHFHRVVLDEAQLIKGLDTKRSRAVMELRTDFRLCLTGTPIMNTVDELYPLLRFLRIERYENQSIFDREIGVPLGRLLDTEGKSAPQVRRYGTSRIRRSINTSTKAALDTVRELLKRIMLRRMKGDKINGQVIVDLPMRIDVYMPVKFSAAERDLYNRLENARGGKTNNFTKRVRLRQMCLHPELVPAELLTGPLAEAYLEGQTESPRQIGGSLSSAKVDAALELLQSIWLKDKTAKIIVFSGFTAFLSKFKALIEETKFSKTNRDFRLGQYNGKMKTQRDDALKDFKRRDAVLLMSTQAGGMGLNIQWATHLIFMEPEYNPYMEDQAIGRAHRVGQTRTVTVYRLFVESTVEESTVEDKIREKQQNKRDLVRLVLGGKEALSDNDSDKVTSF